mgnify:CR=1 FL=1
MILNPNWNICNSDTKHNSRLFISANTQKAANSLRPLIRTCLSSDRKQNFFYIAEKAERNVLSFYYIKKLLEYTLYHRIYSSSWQPFSGPVALRHNLSTALPFIFFIIVYDLRKIKHLPEIHTLFPFFRSACRSSSIPSWASTAEMSSQEKPRRAR